MRNRLHHLILLAALVSPEVPRERGSPRSAVVQPVPDAPQARWSAWAAGGLIVVIAAVLLCQGLAAAAEPAAIHWPEGAEAKIAQIQSVKVEAMQRIDMRSDSGVLGTRFNQHLDELAGLLTAPELRPALEQAEGHDIRAKIALWALDRKARPDLYTRIAYDYVNLPPPEKQKEYYGGRELQGMYHKPVSEDDKREEFRLPLEMAFFSPPTGFGLGNWRDFWRTEISGALAKIGNGKSLIVWVADAQAGSLAAAREKEEPVSPDPTRATGVKNGIRNTGTSIASLWRFPSESSFRSLAELSAKPDLKAMVRQEFSDFLRSGMSQKFKTDTLNTWQELAGKTLQTDAEKDLAALIKASGIPPEKRSGER